MLAGFLIEMIIIVQLALCEEDTVVYSPAGAVRGWLRHSRDGRLYHAWTKIPYAQPPVGKLRFKPPKPAIPWRGVLNVTGDMPHCLQRLDTTSTEDCLYLSIYRPTFTRRAMPVAVFIHPGGFVGGHSSGREQADYVMDEDLVWVAVHYRLAGFGFASLGDEVMPGNFGLKDLALALRWIQSNIESFGGDPKSVTLVGTSAGATASRILERSPATKDLAARTFLDSMLIRHRMGLSPKDYLTNLTLHSAQAVGCDRDNHQAIFLCLQNVNASVLLTAFDRTTSINEGRILEIGPVMEPPTAEDALITEDLSLLSSTKPTIMTFTSGEQIIFTKLWLSLSVERESYQRNLTEYLKRILRTVVNDPRNENTILEGVDILKSVYFSSDESLDNSTVFIQKLSQLQADLQVYYPSLYAIKHHQGPKWVSHFEHVGEVSLYVDPSTGRPFTNAGAAHADITQILLNNRRSVPYAGLEQSQADYAVSKRWVKYMANFVTHRSDCIYIHTGLHIPMVGEVIKHGYARLHQSLLQHENPIASEFIAAESYSAAKRLKRKRPAHLL